MKAIITRNMNVMNAEGENEAYLKSPKPVDLDIGTYQRLNRAGAAIIHVDGEAETEAEQTDTVDLGKLNKGELIAHAASLEVTVPEGATKAEIIETINAKAASQAE